ncbi:NADH-quinone oxidoreductase subunit G [Clostridium cavendishii DSM 21758]|uniref:NADH-quinone oxidoreductase subunit G n=1 Tax=Clostridium cavendishii DSM 21758 TaxID=1121302 RepID=A0A1M6DA68_9CLOT|nr:ferredoxin hydrogenase [Clostridium cavendishii]SHI70162.1 NADH-quinone oxidoreductase subunit G [Clostridium cavendishii DSM 21758]
MIKIVLNGNAIETSEEKSILQVAKENGVDISTLCFLDDCSNVGKCGICSVEIEGQDDLAMACVTKVKDGMVITTNSEKVDTAVKARMSELLDKHEFKCGPCKRRENCEFLKLVIKTKAKASKPFIVADKTPYVDDRSKSIVIDRTKCVECGRCVAACAEKTGTNTIQFIKDGDKTIIGTQGKKCFDETNCLLCGQCINACPVDALSEKTHIDRVKAALEDENKHVIVAMAPSVRTAVGEMFKMGYGVDVTGKIYTALRNLGFDKIFDINFGADMTIMEEATELVQRIEKGGPFPMFTSCCPAWVRQVENYFPQFLDNLSSAKSPQQIFGAASKTYYPTISDIDPANVFTVTIMPCTAKKYEADREEMENNGLRNIDAVITTRELVKMIKDAKIDFAKLEDSEVDPAMGEYTGAGTIFGATGGVMEAALRTAKDFVENANLENVEYQEVRGLKGIKEATVNIGGNDYNVAVINGASNVFEFMKSGAIDKKQYHFIEVMVCPGGCVNGGGQPHVNSKDRCDMDIRSVRASVLYNQDKNLAKRKSHENAAMLKMYESYFGGTPGEGLAHKLLHVKYKTK